MNVLHPGCAWPHQRSPPILWRRFEDGLANTTAIFSILNTATSVSSAEIYPQASSPIWTTNAQNTIGSNLPLWWLESMALIQCCVLSTTCSAWSPVPRNCCLGMLHHSRTGHYKCYRHTTHFTNIHFNVLALAVQVHHKSTTPTNTDKDK